MASLQERAQKLLKSLRISDKNDIFYKAIPAVGTVSYVVYSTKFLAPREFSKICGENSLLISNALLFSTTLGSFFHLYSRKHLTRVEHETQKFVYSSFTSLIFNFGSILFWCLSKAYLPDNEPLKLTYALASSITLLYIANGYLKLIDNE